MSMDWRSGAADYLLCLDRPAGGRVDAVYFPVGSSCRGPPIL